MALGAWSPFKDLHSVAQEYALHNANSSYHRLKALLRQHKPEFFSLLKNAPRSSEQRSKVQNAHTVGLPAEREANPVILEESFIEEALIISDLYELNEFASVDLLLAAEQQVPNYPNYSRGLVAVLLYWDGRRNLVSALRTMMQCREGRTWTMELSDESVAMATTFTDELLQNGLTKQILKLLCDIQVETEMEKLGKQRGLGDAKHRMQVRDLITEVRQCLAECLFYYAGQSGLPCNDVLDLVGHLQKHVGLEANGKLSTTSLALVFTLFYAFVLPYDSQTENDETAIKELMQHPVLSDKNFLSLVQKTLIQQTSQASWKVPGVKACVTLAWSLLLRSVAQIPTSLFTGATLVQPNADVMEQDENVLDESLKDRVFLFMREAIVLSDNFHSEEFYLRRLHGLITDLIINMPLKVKDMRNHGDETARITMLHLLEGEDPPPGMRKDFEQLMQLVTCLYDKDPLNLQLSGDFWPPNGSSFLSDTGSFLATSHRAQRASYKQMALFKFLRQSGDLLPPLLYIPYLQMLSALATGARCARGAFEMLRANGAALGGNGESSNISWDHFFSSCQRYYTNLRHDRPSQDITSPFAPQSPFAGQGHGTPVRGITPQEVGGLRAVMQLTAKIAQYDDIACISIYEHSQWSACGVLFGLLQCPVPVGLKGDILNVIAQFARMPTISMSLLQLLEASQVLHTLPDHWTAGAGKQMGLPDELEEIESREEEFPMTRGFINLLCKLVESGASLAVLGEGTRSPGFDPYLNFAIESVFLKLQSRAYARKEEKWEVASCALRLFNELLTRYQPLPEHFGADRALLPADSMTQHSSFLHDTSMRSSVSSPRSGKPPGYSLLLYIYNEGNFFKTVMNAINECIVYLDKYTPKPAVESTLVEAVILAMELLHNALQLQEPFLSAMRESGKPVMVTTLDKLLLGVNTKSGKADHLVNIAKFVVHNSTHPNLALLAATVISWLCFSSTPTHREVVMVMMNSCNVMTQQKILHGFVEVLDTPCPEDSASYLSQTKLAILRLLIRCIDLPSPNLTQFLLGFDVTKPSSAASLQDPGIMGTRRSCLHSVLTILTLGTDQCAAGSYQPDSVTDTPHLAKLCYQLLYRLSANMDTTGPTMRYLRSSCDLVYKHLQYLPFQNPEGTDTGRTNLTLMQQAWLLKLAAIEIYTLSSKQQRTNVQRLLQLLFKAGGRVAGQAAGLQSTAIFGQSFNKTGFSLRTTFGGDQSTVTSAATTLDPNGSLLPASGDHGAMRIIKIFDLLEFAYEFPPPLALDQFVESVVEQAIQSCETTNEHGVVYCDIKALHDVLRVSLNALSSADDVNRRQIASQEVQKILHVVVERNKTRETVHARLSFLSAWRHALEVAVATCPDDAFSKSARQQILLDILQHLVNRVRQPDAAQDITSPVASIVLALMMHVRSCFTGRDSSPEVSFYSKDHLFHLLDAEENAVVDLNNIAPLQVVVRGIVEWLLLSGLSEKVRTDLYASLLYYLQLCRRPKSSPYKGTRDILSSLDDVHAKLNRDNFKLFKSYGEAFVDLVCKDACNGQSVCRVLALACLDSMVQIDVQQTWLQYMIRNGYLGHISHSILTEDEQLQQYLDPSAEPLRSVFIYEQKMALLCSIAQTPAGARATIDSGALVQLSECTFLEMRPRPDKTESNAFAPDMTNRFRQLLFPALRFCSALLATHGGQTNCEIGALVLQFLLAHADSIVNAALRMRSVPTDVQALTELQLLTGVLSQTAGQDFTDPSMFGSVPQDILIEIQGHLLRIQRQLLSLLPNVFLSQQTAAELKQSMEVECGEGSDSNFEEVTHLLHSIGCNILVYCRSVVLRSSADSSVFLFAPDMSESTLDAAPYGPDRIRRQPAVGIVFRILRNVTSRYASQYEDKKREEWKLDNVDNFTAGDLKEVIGDSVYHLSLPQEQKLASLILYKSIKRKESHLRCLYHIVENALLLLWQHLDYFILKVAPLETLNSNILFPKRSEDGARIPLRRLQDNPNPAAGPASEYDVYVAPQLGREVGVRRIDIERLKRELPASIPSHFLQKLCQIEVQSKGSAGYFIQPLVRRLQHIIKLHSQHPH